jgi:hypothetical protein
MNPQLRITTRLLVLAVAALIGATAQAQAQLVPYPLGKLPDGFTVQWPTAPKISRSVDVSTIADFNKAAATAGTLINIKGQISGQGNINASDIEVRMDDKASIGGVLIGLSVKRVALIGGHYTGTIEMLQPSTFYPSRVDNPAWAVEDVMLDGINVRSTNSTGIFLRGHRVAVIRSFSHGADYGIYSDTISADHNSDIIIAGNQIEAEGRQATLRLIQVSHSVTVENRLTDLMQTGEKHNYRVHGNSNMVFAARNELVNSGTMLGTMPNDNVTDLWFNDNTFHHKTPDLFNPDRAQVHNLHAHNNVAYTDIWPCFFCGGVPAGWDLGNNVIKPYQAPPAAPALQAAH